MASELTRRLRADIERAIDEDRRESDERTWGQQWVPTAARDDKDRDADEDDEDDLDDDEDFDDDLDDDDDDDLDDDEDDEDD